VEPGEEPAAALVREIREELGCDIVVGRALPHCTHAYATMTIELIPFLCRLTPGSVEPHPHEHAAVLWATLAELRTLDLAAADWPWWRFWRHDPAKPKSSAPPENPKFENPKLETRGKSEISKWTAQTQRRSVYFRIRISAELERDSLLIDQW